MDVLDAMIRDGFSLARSVDLAAQWDEILKVEAVNNLLRYRILSWLRAVVLVSVGVLWGIFIVGFLIPFIGSLFIVSSCSSLKVAQA